MGFDDKLACMEVIQRWGLCRDQGRWPDLLATFTPDGEISVSWFSGPFPQFVDRCRAGFEAGQRSKHHILPSVVRVAGDRAIGETSIVIHVRQDIGGVPVDMSSHGRFLDRLERRDGRWAIRERCAIYERDRLDPVEPSEAFDRIFRNERFLRLSGAVPLHGGAAGGDRTAARAGGLSRRRRRDRGIVRALRGVACGKVRCHERGGTRGSHTL